MRGIPLTRAVPSTPLTMASRDAEARIPLLHGKGRDDALPARVAQKSRVALLAGVGAVAGLALVGVRGAPSVLSSLGFDDGSGRPTLYAMLDQAPLADQLKHLQCYRKMAEDADMQLAVGEYTSDHFEDTVRLDDLVANEGQGWRSMTRGDWQRIEDAGGPDLCITARDEDGEDGASYAYPGGTIVSDADSVITSYDDVIRELKTREWWTCLGSQAFDECTAKDAQLDFRPSPHVTEVMQIAQKSMFGKDNDKGFRAAHLSEAKQRKREKNAGDAYKAFRNACEEAKAGMGPPVYVATGPSPKVSKIHAKLHEMGCVTYQNITGYDMLQDWELAAMDQFLLAEAKTHVTTACSAADSIAAASRRMRAAAKSEVYIATSDAFLDVPTDADERACAMAVDAMARTTDATKSADEAFDEKVRDAAEAVAARIAAEEAAAGGGEDDAADTHAEAKARAKDDTENPTGVGEDAGETATTATDAPADSAEGDAPAGDAEPPPAGAEDRVSAVEKDVSGLKEGMRNIMSTLFNIQEQLKANPGAGPAAGSAADAAKTSSESTQDSVARIIADAKAARAAVDAAKSSSAAEKKAGVIKATSASASTSRRATAEADDASEVKAKAPPVEEPEEKDADEALKAPVAADDLESYEAKMMGPGNVE